MNKEILPVLDEISQVLAKHDMAGLFVVANKTHCDWRMEISPSWSCAWIENDNIGHCLIRIKSNLADYPDKHAQKLCQERTIGTFVTFGDTLDRLRQNVNRLLMVISKHIDFLGKSTNEDG